jgi:hypothetical protein
MATDKKHIAVYLDPALEKALIAFCEQRGLISKKGTMYSAGVNAALAAFFGVRAYDADDGNIPQNIDNTPQVTSNTPQVTSNTPQVTSNTPQVTSNTPQVTSNTPQVISNIPNNTISDIPSNIPTESINGELLPGKLRA